MVVYKIFIVNVVSMQPDNHDLFKGHGLGSPGGSYGLSYSGQPKWGKSPELGGWGGGVQKYEDTMTILDV